MRNVNQWAKVGQILFICFCVALVYSIQPYRLFYNYTESVIQGIFISDTRPTNIKKGDFVIFVYPEPIWARGRYISAINKIDYFFKQVKGEAGDLLTVNDKKQVLLCVKGNKANCYILETLSYKDSVGRIMYPIEWKDYTIPYGYVYVGTDYKKSLSSSYYGLIAVNKMIAKTYPLYTWHAKFTPVAKSMIPD